MRFILSILKFIFRCYWGQSYYSHFLKFYLINFHLKNVAKFFGESVATSNRVSVYDAMFCSAFCHGFLDLLFKPNNFKASVKDLYVVLYIGVLRYEDKYLLDIVDKKALADVSYVVAQRLKLLFITDAHFRDYLRLIGKEPLSLFEETDRAEIDALTLKPANLFSTYFRHFDNPNYKEETLTIYFPNLKNGGVDRTKENSITISIQKNELGRGLFLVGFDYKSSILGDVWLVCQDRNRSYINPRKKKGSVVWAR